MKYVTFFMGDYDRDTMALSLLEDGAYFRLLRHYWSKEQPIENLKEAYAIARATNKKERDAVLSVLSRFFIQNSEEKYVNKKSESIIKKAKEKGGNYSENGKKGRKVQLNNSGQLPSKSPGIPLTINQEPSKGNLLVNSKTSSRVSPAARSFLKKEKNVVSSSQSGYGTASLGQRVDLPKTWTPSGKSLQVLDSLGYQAAALSDRLSAFIRYTNEQKKPFRDADEAFVLYVKNSKHTHPDKRPKCFQLCAAERFRDTRDGKSYAGKDFYPAGEMLNHKRNVKFTLPVSLMEIMKP